MQRIKLFFKLLALVVFVSLSACTQTNTPVPSKLTDEEADIIIHEIQTAYPDNNLDKLMQEKNVTLTAKEVQYNMSNNVDKEFGLEGSAEICDYYNWGYDKSIESDYFCMHVTPSGGYLESWYIYVGRTNGEKLYQDLLQGNQYVVLIAKIDGFLYEKNQQNQASGVDIEW